MEPGRPEPESVQRSPRIQASPVSRYAAGFASSAGISGSAYRWLGGLAQIEMSSKRNRAFWNSVSTTYQVAHGPTLSQQPMAWGVWRIAESELGVDLIRIGGQVE